MTIGIIAPETKSLPIKIRVQYVRRLKDGSLRTIQYWRNVKADSKRVAGQKLVRHSVRTADGSFVTFLTLPGCVPAIARAERLAFAAKAATAEGHGTSRVMGVFERNRFV